MFLGISLVVLVGVAIVSARYYPYFVRVDLAGGTARLERNSLRWAFPRGDFGPPSRDDGGYFRTKKGAEQWIQEQVDGSWVFAVFYSTAEGRGFVSEEHCFSGNWRGSMYDPYVYVGDFASREEAREALLKEESYCQ